MDFKPFAFVFVLALSLNVARCDAEPRCSKFDFEEKLLEKVVRMEHATNVMMEQFKELSMEVKDSLHKIKENFEEIKVEAKEELKRVKRISEGKYRQFYYPFYHDERDWLHFINISFVFLLHGRQVLWVL